MKTVLIAVVLAANLPLLGMSRLDEKRAMIAKENLGYIHAADLQKFIQGHLLVQLKSNQYLEVNKKLAARGCWVRPWVVPILNRFAKAYYEKWGKPIKVNSALRTVEYHRSLRKRNLNAAQGYSPHSTGATVDVSHLWFSHKKMQWVKAWWAPYVERKEVVVTTEFFQQCWDIFFCRPHATAGKRAKN